MASDTGFGGRSSPKLYRIRVSDASAIQYRMLDSINALRKSAGARPVELNAKLNAAAATHSRDMSVQNRPWHFGSDGSSPLDRVKRVGFEGQFRGENISETYETELVTLGAWMDQTDTRRVILDPTVTDVGFSWYQESNGKIWWTLVLGSQS
nr:CAP domain-containing protein [Thalassovita gelatinovora]